MSDPLFDLLRKYFRFNLGLDNLPILASPRTGLDTGREQLAKVMNEMGFRDGVEIGTRHGGSAKIWCEAMPGLNLTCIDPYIGGQSRTQKHQDDAYENAKVHAKEFGFTLWKMTSREATSRIRDDSLDFINIDGDHRFDVCVVDLIEYVPKVRKGGFILMHDYCVFKQAGTMKAIDSYTHCHRIDPWYVTRDREPTVFWQRGAEQL